MATAQGIAAALTVMHEAFPQKEITEATAPLWLGWFRDEPDEELLRAANAIALDRTRKFFPSPGEFRAVLHPIPVIDVPAIVRQIEALGHYNAQTGWSWPSVETVRNRLGDGIAEAYGLLGARLGQDQGPGLDIATREFSNALLTALHREGGHILKAPDTAKTLPAEKTSQGDTVRQLSSTRDAKRHYDRD